MPGEAPIVYFKIGWMKSYAGPQKDAITGGHQFLQDHDFGGEAYNFSPYPDGIVRGCRPGSRRNLAIEKLGASRTDAFVDDVLVVWMAREPVSRKTLVVGWYKAARIYREAFDPPGARNLPDGQTIPVTAEATPNDVVLLPIEARNFQIASARVVSGGFGQSPTWYGNDRVDKLVRAYISDTGGRIGRSRSKGRPRQPDIEKRKAVEAAAVNHAIAYFKSEAGGSCDVESYETEGRGWDLEATDGSTTWLIEVKGLSGADLRCEVTPNEFDAMRRAGDQERYILYVVCNALSDAPIASLFRFERSAWRSEDGRKLDVQERTAAILSCS